MTKHTSFLTAVTGPASGSAQVEEWSGSFGLLVQKGGVARVDGGGGAKG